MRYRVGHTVKFRVNFLDVKMRIVDILPDSRIRLHTQASDEFSIITKSEVIEHYGIDKWPETEDVGNTIIHVPFDLDESSLELNPIVDKALTEKNKSFFLGKKVGWTYEVDGACIEVNGYIVQCELKDEMENSVLICTELFTSQPSRYWVVSVFCVDFL
jgi:hypothetical protein